MAEDNSPFEREVRDTIVKSSFTGVAATAMAIVAFSPAGFGDWIGASVASSFGVDSTALADDNAYAVLPAYPTPMTRDEVNAIHAQLASSEASMTLVRAATNEKIEQVRTIALGDELPMLVGQAPAEDAPVESYVAVTGPEAAILPVSYTAAVGGGGFDASVPYRDPHLELADLLLAHETF
jgi:hypothetical protein